MKGAWLFFVFISTLAALPAMGGGSGITLDMLSELRAERAHLHEGYSFHGFDANGRPVLAPREDMEFSTGVANLSRIYGVPFCVEYEYHTAERPTMPALNIRTGQRLVDALDDLADASNGLADWRLMDGAIVIRFRARVEEAHSPLLDRVLLADIQAYSLEEALLAFEEAFNATEPGPPRIPLIISALCGELAGRFHDRVKDTGAPFTIRGEATARDMLLSIVSFLGAGETRYSMVLAGSPESASHARLHLYSVPCDDRHRPVEELERLEREFAERDERRLQYQQAIDEARASAEREAVE